MMSGKAVARAVRGHFLVDTALNAILLQKTVGITHSAMSTSDEENKSSEKGSDMDLDSFEENIKIKTSAENKQGVTEDDDALEYFFLRK
ncbi:hypothetical protein DPMN_097176 [Dreissena polymorpha]|uniref:Uncharacterized protein n=1 Tax=Dreissena polymorpha TaxID=45954 RepID=A0A9D4LAM7_DREPO|nr:hypothetical protein DPMN_097176 [Dreissena polymorpha]